MRPYFLRGGTNEFYPCTLLYKYGLLPDTNIGPRLCKVQKACKPENFYFMK